jgi:hypothetical protein
MRQLGDFEPIEKSDSQVKTIHHHVDNVYQVCLG